MALERRRRRIAWASVSTGSQRDKRPGSGHRVRTADARISARSAHCGDGNDEIRLHTLIFFKYMTQLLANLKILFISYGEKRARHVLGPYILNLKKHSSFGEKIR